MPNQHQIASCVSADRTDYLHLPSGEITAIGGRLLWRLDPGGVCQIVDIEVEAQHRREGIGRLMLKTLIEQMKSKHYSINTVFAFVREENMIAREWYTACGFCLYHLPGFYGTDGNAYGCVLKF